MFLHLIGNSNAVDLMIDFVWLEGMKLHEL